MTPFERLLMNTKYTDKWPECFSFPCVSCISWFKCKCCFDLCSTLSIIRCTIVLIQEAAMRVQIKGAREHNLQGVDVEIGDGLTVVTGVSGSGKTSLVFDTLYHEARRRFLEVYELGSPKGRLAPAHVDEITGLGPAVAVGQNLLNRNPSSTLATASGLHPFLRLLYAHFAERACARCGAPVNVFTEDEIVARLTRLAESGPLEVTISLVHGVPGSHRTLLAALETRFGRAALRVDGLPWQGNALEAGQSHTIAVVVESPPRRAVQQAAALGATSLIALIPDSLPPDPLTFSSSPVCPACGTWFTPLRPVDFNRACPHCAGKGCEACAHTGLPPEAAAARWNGLRLPELLALSVDEASVHFSQAADLTPRISDEITRRLNALQRVGLGYIALDRPSPTLSRGEAQRVRLALTLISRLEDMLHVLDEPTVGQHPADIQRLLPAFRELAGPVVYVEHERAAAIGADRAIDIGPGAGADGGRVVFEGTPSELWQAETATGRYFSGRARVQPPELRPAPEQFLVVRGANLRNLQNIDVPIPLGRLTVITGVSGSGKSTFVEDVLVASLCKGEPIGCLGVEAFAGDSDRLKPRLPVEMKPVLVDQSPIGRNPRSNPATYTKLADIIRDLFAAVTGLSPSQFSFNRPEGACPTCEGLGAIEVSMRYLPSTWIPCGDCDGARFNEDVLAAKVEISDLRFSIADFFALSIEQVRQIFATETRLPKAKLAAARRILDALCDIGLGYLSLGQPSPTLSGGEAQRVKLAKYLGQNSLEKELLILDEPSTGLHPQDLAGLLTVLDRLTRGGATIVIVEHNTDVMRAADWVIDLGPGAGPRGGQLLYAGPVAGLQDVDSPTGRALREEDSLIPDPESPVQGIRNQGLGIRIENARVHNLRNVSVEIPKAKFTVVTGVSGSGKSSLVHDVLEAEARRRFLETLSLYERQGTREGPEAEVDSVSGLGVALTVGSQRLVYSRRATVGTATEISHHLAVLLATLGERKCLECGANMTPSPALPHRKTTDRGGSAPTPVSALEMGEGRGGGAPSPISALEMGEGRGGGWLCPSCHATAPLAAPRHFSSSTYAAACLKCNGIGTLQAPNPAKLIIAPEKPLTEGAMYSPGFFPNGYLGKPFNGGYYQVQALGRHFGFDPALTPWKEMTPEAQQAFLFGSDVPLTIHYESRTGRSNTYQGKWPGFYGLIRDWDVGGTYTDARACPACGGARLRPEYLAVTLAGKNVHELSGMTLAAFESLITDHLIPEIGDQESGIRNVAASLRTIQQRLRFLIQVGLGYLHLDRVAGTLSAGEAQRIRLASLLGSGLTSLTLLLDEPTRGLHPCEVDALIAALARLRDEGNTVIVVEHDPQVMLAADWLIDVGPGAGQLGGQIVAQGTPADVAKADTLTGKWLRGMQAKSDKENTQHGTRTTQHALHISGARANNLKNISLSFPLNQLVGVCGVSGSGKSTLMMDTMGRALAPKKQTTSVAYEPVDPGEYDAIEGAPARVLLVDQSKAGVSSPVGFLGLVKPLQSLFAESEAARALGISEEQLAARCSVCGGTGVISLDMAFLPDVHQLCETCRGTGCVAEAWDVRLGGVSYPEAFGLTIDQAYELFVGDEPSSPSVGFRWGRAGDGVARPLQAARDVGLGYLVLRQPGYALSGGEAQRLKIASELMRTPQSPIKNQKSAITNTLYLLDEPSIGQHLEDVARLAGVLRRLVDEGGSVIVVDHHTHLLAACDWLIELGPVGGPEGGSIIAEGTPWQLATGNTPTAPYLKKVLSN
jgi:excinuclease ABC subunit A